MNYKNILNTHLFLHLKGSIGIDIWSFYSILTYIY